MCFLPLNGHISYILTKRCWGFHNLGWWCSTRNRFDYNWCTFGFWYLSSTRNLLRGPCNGLEGRWYCKNAFIIYPLRICAYNGTREHTIRRKICSWAAVNRIKNLLHTMRRKYITANDRQVPYYIFWTVHLCPPWLYPWNSFVTVKITKIDFPTC